MQKTFNADVAQLIKLVTHSIYSNKEIFVRELVANANDAIQKAKILAAGDANYLGDETELKIAITIDKDAKTLTLIDNGIGMSMQDVENNIGTIASSGTKKFLEQLKNVKSSDANMVGQFGIGFYSAFMVAHTVEVFTKTNGEDSVHRSSNGDANYTIEQYDETMRGTRIVLHLTDECSEFLEDYRIKTLVRKYADYLPTPIMMIKKSEVKKDADGNNIVEEGTPEVIREQINKTKAIRQKMKKDVTAEEYKEHFGSLAYASDHPLDVIHVSVEGNVNYKAVLYIPKTPNPFANMQDPNAEYGPALYVQNVMIMDHCKDLLPNWLRFVVGVVETSDIPLNVSREILQQSKVMATIQQSLVKEIIKSMIYIKKENPDQYTAFLSHYERMIKEGIYFDRERQEDLAGLLAFAHHATSDKISLDTYIMDNTEKLTGLKHIYYIHVPTYADAAHHPLITKCTKRGLDVIVLTDPIDEYVTQMLTTYKEHTLINIAGSDIPLPPHTDDETSKKETEQQEADHKNFLDYVTTMIGADMIEKTSFGHDMGESLAIVQQPAGQPSAQMMRMYKAMGQDIPTSKKTLIINPTNPLVQSYISQYESTPDSEKVRTFVSYIYDQACLLEGSDIESMSGFIAKVNKLIG